MTPWCNDLVCSWRRLLADRHSLPFPWTLFLHRRWCPSASHHPVTFLFLQGSRGVLPPGVLPLWLSAVQIHPCPTQPQPPKHISRGTGHRCPRIYALPHMAAASPCTLPHRLGDILLSHRAGGHKVATQIGQPKSRQEGRAKIPNKPKLGKQHRHSTYTKIGQPETRHGTRKPFSPVSQGASSSSQLPTTSQSRSASDICAVSTSLR